MKVSIYTVINDAYFKFGQIFVEFLEKNGTLWFTIIGILIVLVFLITFFYLK